jgi:hypothetical protein
MRMAWFTVCLLAAPAAMAQSATLPEGVQVIPQNEGVLVAPQVSGNFPGQPVAPPVWQSPWRGQGPMTFSFAKPAPMPPVAKGIPIPTQWPKAKMEQIPTHWPNLQVVPLRPQASSLGAVVLPSRK